jgi:hypothetical protein
MVQEHRPQPEGVDDPGLCVYLGDIEDEKVKESRRSLLRVMRKG